MRGAAAGERVRPSAQESCFGPLFLTGGPPPRGSVEGSLSDFCPSGYPSSVTSPPERTAVRVRYLLPCLREKLFLEVPVGGLCYPFSHKSPLRRHGRLWSTVQVCRDLKSVFLWGEEFCIAHHHRLTHAALKPTGGCRGETPHRREDQT